METMRIKTSVFKISHLKCWTPLHFSQGKFSFTDGKPEKKGVLYDINSGPTEHTNFTLRLTFGLLKQWDVLNVIKCVTLSSARKADLNVYWGAVSKAALYPLRFGDLGYPYKPAKPQV